MREATGRNDGDRVGQYLFTVKLGKGYAWCAAFVKWCLMQCGINTSINAWAGTACNTKNYVYRNTAFTQPPAPGDVFTIYSYSQRRVSHVGFFHRLNGKAITTVEGNTNTAGSREGDGVYMRVRPLFSIHSISRWQ